MNTDTSPAMSSASPAVSADKKIQAICATANKSLHEIWVALHDKVYDILISECAQLSAAITKACRKLAEEFKVGADDLRFLYCMMSSR